MSSFKDWFSAARPRTLPLALAGLALGNFLASTSTSFSSIVCALSIVTATLLQVLSNFANDYGDYVNGADNENRIGPARAVQSGAISKKAMLRGIIITGVFSLLAGLSLLYYASSVVNIFPLLAMLALGLFAIAAAYKYTASSNPYGYKGLGDIAVFLFFGLVAVLGIYYLQTGHIDLIIFLPAMAFGALSTGVLNLNNMRDIRNDADVGKITIPVRLGLSKAKSYHYALMLVGSTFFVIFSLLTFHSWYQYLFLTPLSLLITHSLKVKKRRSYAEFNPLLKELSLSSALIALSIGTAYIII